MGDKQHIANLLAEIEDQLQWGESKHWSGKDFENLVDEIYAKTDHKLSVTTLKRLWGRSSQEVQPSVTTLDILSNYLDYGPWRAFIKKNTIPQKPFKRKILTKLFISIVLVLLVGKALHFLIKHSQKINPDNIQFSYSVESKGLPNSIYFEYDLGPYDSSAAFINLTGTREDIIPVKHSKGSAGYLFYEPGYYHASLTIDNELAANQKIYIPTSGWAGYLNAPIQNFPIYLSNKDLIQADSLSISTDFLSKLVAQKNYFNITLSHVLDSPKIDGDNFNVNVDLLKQFDFETSPCGVITLKIIGLDGSIDFGFSNSGCVGDLSFNFNGDTISAKENNLSAFGNISNDWMNVQVVCEKLDLNILVNGQIIFEYEMTKSLGKIGGISLIMDGSFVFKNISMKDESNLALKFL